MTENGIFSEFQKTKHVEPRAFFHKKHQNLPEMSLDKDAFLVKSLFASNGAYMWKVRSHEWLTDKSKN